jgi:hypothetical protein
MDWWRQALSTGWVGSVISLLGLLVGLVSLVAAVLIYRASRVGGRLIYQLHALHLISGGPYDLPSEVEILFKGRAVPRLTRTLLVLWNSGKALIRGSDVVIDNPIQFVFSNDAEVLRVRTLKVTRPEIKFSARLFEGRPNTATCEFDYLGPGDGVVVEILHTDDQCVPIRCGCFRQCAFTP